MFFHGAGLAFQITGRLRPQACAFNFIGSKTTAIRPESQAHFSAASPFPRQIIFDAARRLA